MKNDRKGTQNGFTLIELLVAVALMAVMFTALSVVFQQATAIIRRSESEIDIYQTFRLVSRIIKRDFESIINYEEPVFYNRYDEYGDPNAINNNPLWKGKLDYCGYLRIEGHQVTDTKGNVYVTDNFSFLVSDTSFYEIRNYLAKDPRGVETYVKTDVKGTDLVEISYAIEDKRGKVVHEDSDPDMDGLNKWKLVRYARKVVSKSLVTDPLDPTKQDNDDLRRGWFGLVYKGYEDFQNLTGYGPDGMDIFNGSSKDYKVVIDFSTDPPSRTYGEDPRINKYGRRDVIAEGCTDLDIKYWYYRVSAPDQNWQPNRTWSNTLDGNPDSSMDPYVAIGHFYNGMPPNPACMDTPNNPRDDETESLLGNEFAGDHPNWWYLPRMIQVRLKLLDRHEQIHQPFIMRIYVPSSNPRPMVTP